MLTLQEFTSSIISSFLGPNKRNKLIIDGQEACVARCPLLMFQKTVLQDPMSHLVEETLLAHHMLYGCSTLTLLTMWFLWKEEFNMAVENGCDLQDIKLHSQAILETVINSVSQISINLDTLLKPTRSALNKINSMKNVRKAGLVPLAVRYSSRHFSPSAQNDQSLEESFENCEETSETFLGIVKRLDHDSDLDMSSLLADCWERQRKFSKSVRFETDRLHICPIVLASSYTCLLDGLLLKSNFSSSCQQIVKNSNNHKVLILNGSVTFEYVHLGFSPKVKVTEQKSCGDLSLPEKDIWLQKCCELILKFNIDALLIKEDIDPNITEFCLSHSVLVLPHVPWSSLKVLCTFLQYSPCTYILDCNEKSLLSNAVISEWNPKNTSMDAQYFMINLDSKNEGPLQTIALCHPSLPFLEMKEHQLWHLTARLASVALHKKLLPGTGKVEDYCYNILYRDITNVSSPIANGFKKYSELVKMKQETSTLEINDDLTSKIASWRSALSLALLTMQCDMSIMNGTDYGDL